MVAAKYVDREYEFTDAHFQLLRKLVVEHTGIELSDAKRELVYSRLSRRLRDLEIDNFGEYCRYVVESDDEITNFINAITTNLTSFFREKHHFEYLKTKLIPKLLKDNYSNRKVRIWSAGCSTGEESYSIAMIIMDSIPEVDQWDIKILATDIDSNVLAKAKSGIGNIPAAYKKRWLKHGKGENAGLMKIANEIQKLISFRQLNLMNIWPMKGSFDIIFCRNVVIYFDKATQGILFNRFADMLKSDGHLFIGHSETLYKVSNRFNLLGKTIYQRCI
jgi:chemotaxis protein methyltransferase CheR